MHADRLAITERAILKDGLYPRRHKLFQVESTVYTVAIVGLVCVTTYAIALFSLKSNGQEKLQITPLADMDGSDARI